MHLWEGVWVPSKSTEVGIRMQEKRRNALASAVSGAGTQELNFEVETTRPSKPYLKVQGAYDKICTYKPGICSFRTVT